MRLKSLQATASLTGLLLKAISKASPLPPPPIEMEIGRKDIVL